jgi:hypothetical protein
MRGRGLTKTIGETLFDYDEAKETMRTASQELIQKAVEQGCNEKAAQDARVAYAYLVGLTRRKK